MVNGDTSSSNAHQTVWISVEIKFIAGDKGTACRGNNTRSVYTLVMRRQTGEFE